MIYLNKFYESRCDINPESFLSNFRDFVLQLYKSVKILYSHQLHTLRATP